MSCMLKVIERSHRGRIECRLLQQVGANAIENCLERIGQPSAYGVG